MAINYPYRVFRYRVDIDGISRAGFSEVSGVSMNTDVVEYREGDDLRNTPRKLPGLTKFGNVTLRWGVTDDSDFLEWLLSVAPSNQAPPTGLVRHDITITLIDDSGSDGPSWHLINAWPAGYTVPDLNGTGGDVAIQSLELAHEGLEHTPGGPSGEPSPI